MTPAPREVLGLTGRRTTDHAAAAVVKENRAAPRVPASCVPAITGVRLSPQGIEATLVNISARGVAVECGGRLMLKSEVTVLFDGTFEPSSVEGHVARCAVAGLGQDGELRYEVGIAFVRPIEFLQASPPEGTRPEPLRASPAATPPATVVRNRW